VTEAANRTRREPPVPRWEPVTAEQFPIMLPKGQRIDAGYLVVRENRTKPHGRTIRLPVAIVRSRSATPAPDPVVYTAGGPGASSLTAAQYGGAYRFTDTRDLIILEQRGTRHADPPLECPEVNASKKDGALRSLDAAGRAALDAAAAAACRARLVAAGIDPAAYTTAASAEDLADLRRVLGIPKWNLYGESYSTRLMLAVLRDHPTGVRSVVLDSPFPPSERYDPTAVTHYAQALDAVSRDCDAQPACRAAYPDLLARFYAALAGADRVPLTVATRDPNGTGEIRMSLRGNDLARLVDPADTGALPGLPRLMDQIARRDAAALRPHVERSLGPKGYAWGMRYSVWCGEETPSKRTGKSAPKRNPHPALAHLDLSPVPPDVCRAWRMPPVPSREAAPVRSAVPTLLISGEYDPYTPPAWAAVAARALPRSRILTFRGVGHVPTQVWDQPCAMTVAAAFVAAPDRDPAMTPAGSCLAGGRAPTFTMELRTP
jgi:pimeloyl-ACP methyl ester carboxylesterase